MSSDRRVIVAAFEPFAGKRRNRARDAARLLRGEELGGAAVEIVDLPVAYAAIPDALRRLFARDPALRPAGRRIGRGAHAARRAAGGQRRARAHRATTPAPARSTTSWSPGGEAGAPGARSIRASPANAAIAAGCPCEVSSHAGTFCCNAALYHALGQAAAAPDRPRVAFVHVPARFPWARDRRAARGLYAIAKHLRPPPLSLDVRQRPIL